MPGGNGTGPVGMGPMTGRAAGFCAGYAGSGYANPGGTRGCGMGMGRGRGGQMGRGRGFGWNGVANSYPAPQNLTADQELETLKGQADYFEDSLRVTRERIAELKGRNK